MNDDYDGFFAPRHTIGETQYTVCVTCGAAIFFDSRDEVDNREAHIEWHSDLIKLAIGKSKDNEKFS